MPLERPPTDRDDSSEKMILISEDDPLLRETLKVALEGVGYRTVRASSGDEAWDIWRKADFPIDLIVTDVVLPGMDGLELVRRVRDEAPDARVVVISGTPATDGSIAGRIPDDVSFVSKPFELRRLLKAIDEAFNRKREDRRRGPFGSSTDL